MADLKVHPDIIAHLKTIHLTPVTVRKIFLLLTRSHYSTANNYGELAKQLQDFVWKPGPDNKLFIDLDYNYDPKNMDRRPAIFVGSDDFGFEQTVLDGSARYTDDNAGEEFVNRTVTRVIIRHVGKTPDESLQLADLSAQFFRSLRQVMKNQLELTRYVVARISSTKPFDKDAVQADKHFVADVIIELAFNSEWVIWTESHRLKDWSFEDMVKCVGG